MTAPSRRPHVFAKKGTFSKEPRFSLSSCLNWWYLAFSNIRFARHAYLHIHLTGRSNPPPSEPLVSSKSGLHWADWDASWTSRMELTLSTVQYSAVQYNKLQLELCEDKARCFLVSLLFPFLFLSFLFFSASCFNDQCDLDSQRCSSLEQPSLVHSSE